jgi:glycosyltransferase involved in cell wall biosynthesis
MTEQSAADTELVDLSVEGDPHGATLSLVNEELLKALRRAGSMNVAAGAGRAQVRVRHRWPPDWTAPRDGAWVLMQPWGYGTIPLQWVDPIQSAVDEVWVPSEYVRKGYIASGIPAARVHVVPYGVDPAVFHPGAPPWPNLTDKPVRFLDVGGTLERKGTDVLLRAYLEAFTRDDPVCLIIKDQGAGMFYAGATVRDEIERARLDASAPEIVYLNRETPHDELAGLYAACTCLVHPYRGEGFVLPVVEAMASGRPVVVTAGGPTDDLLPDDVGWRIPAASRRVEQVGDLELAGPGWVLEPDRKALVEILRQIAANPAVCRERGRLARTAAEHLTWDRMAALVILRARRLQSLPPRRNARRLLGGRPAPVSYLAVPDWTDADTLRVAVAHYLEKTAPRLPSTLYVWAPSGDDLARCRSELNAVAAVRRVPPERSVEVLCGGPRVRPDAILSAVDGVIPCGSRAEQPWLARVKALGRDQSGESAKRPAAPATAHANVIEYRDLVARKQSADGHRQRVAELEAIISLSRRLRATSGLTDMCTVITEHAMDVVRTDHGALALFDPAREALTCTCSRGDPGPTAGMSLSLTGSLPGWVVRTGVRYLTEDLPREPLPRGMNAEAYLAFGPVVIVPVRAEQQVVGTLALARSRRAGQRPFTDDDLTLLAGIAELAGTAIRRAQLQQELTA